MSASVLRAIPVGLVVVLPRTHHDRYALVNQVIPVMGRSDAGLPPAMDRSDAIVEWTCGTVSTTNDCEGLLEEERVRNRHYFQLSPCTGQPTWCSEAAPDETEIAPVAAFASLRCPRRSAPAVEEEERVRGEHVSNIKQICTEQLRRMRWWSDDRQRLPLAPAASLQRAPMAGEPPLKAHRSRNVKAAASAVAAGFDVDRDHRCMNVLAARIVAADQRRPWSYTQSIALQHLSGIHLHGANVTSAPSLDGGSVDDGTGVAGSSPSVPTPMFFVNRRSAPHDGRFLTPNDLRSVINELPDEASKRRMQREAEVSSMECLKAFAKNRIAVAGEIFALRPLYVSDQSVRKRVQVLLDWYERHGTVAHALRILSAEGFVPVATTEADVIKLCDEETDRVADDPKELVRTLQTFTPLPGELPAAPIIARADSKFSATSAAIMTYTALAFDAATRIGRTPTLIELTSRRQPSS